MLISAWEKGWRCGVGLGQSAATPSPESGGEAGGGWWWWRESGWGGEEGFYRILLAGFIYRALGRWPRRKLRGFTTDDESWYPGRADIRYFDPEAVLSGNAQLSNRGITCRGGNHQATWRCLEVLLDPVALNRTGVCVAERLSERRQ